MEGTTKSEFKRYDITAFLLEGHQTSHTRLGMIHHVTNLQGEQRSILQSSERYPVIPNISPEDIQWLDENCRCSSCRQFSSGKVANGRCLHCQVNVFD